MGIFLGYYCANFVDKLYESTNHEHLYYILCVIYKYHILYMLYRYRDMPLEIILIPRPYEINFELLLLNIAVSEVTSVTSVSHQYLAYCVSGRLAIHRIQNILSSHCKCYSKYKSKNYRQDIGCPGLWNLWILR